MLCLLGRLSHGTIKVTGVFDEWEGTSDTCSIKWLTAEEERKRREGWERLNDRMNERTMWPCENIWLCDQVCSQHDNVRDIKENHQEVVSSVYWLFNKGER